MKNEEIELFEKLLENISESEKNLNNFIKNLDQKSGDATDLKEISLSLEKTLNRLRNLNDNTYSEEE